MLKGMRTILSMVKFNVYNINRSLLKEQTAKLRDQLYYLRKQGSAYSYFKSCNRS